MNDPNLTKAAGKVPRNGLERWARRGLISNEPPFTRWDRLILVLVLILVLLMALGAGLPPAPPVGLVYPRGGK